MCVCIYIKVKQDRKTNAAAVSRLRLWCPLRSGRIQRSWKIGCIRKQFEWIFLFRIQFDDQLNRNFSSLSSCQMQPIIIIIIIIITTVHRRANLLAPLNFALA